MADHRGPGTRTKARKRALDILFESELRDRDPLETLAERVDDAEPPVRPFTAEIVEGVTADLPLIDKTITESLAGEWTLARMPRVDRNLARVAVYEMFFTDLAPEIAVNEAVGLARELSTDSSPDFLNGVLGRALRTLRETYPATPRTTDDRDRGAPAEPDAAGVPDEPDADGVPDQPGDAEPQPADLPAPHADADPKD